MRDEAAAFDCEQEIRRRRVAPVVESFRGGKMIEAVVDLDGVEVLRVKLEHARRWCARGIKHVVEPMFVVPAGCADVDLHYKPKNARIRSTSASNSRLKDRSRGGDPT